MDNVIRIYHPDLSYKGAIRNFYDFTFTEKLNDIGSFSFKCPYSKDVISVLTERVGDMETTGSIMYYNENIYGKIDSWTVDWDKQEVDVSGSSLEIILSWRGCCFHEDDSNNAYTININDTADINKMVRDVYENLNSGFGQYIGIPNFKVVEYTRFGDYYSAQRMPIGGRSLLDVLQSVAENRIANPIKFKISLDLDKKMFLFTCLEIIPLIKHKVSDHTHTLSNVKYTRSDKTLCNGSNLMYVSDIRVKYDVSGGSKWFRSYTWPVTQDYTSSNVSAHRIENSGYWYRPDVGELREVSVPAQTAWEDTKKFTFTWPNTAIDIMAKESLEKYKPATYDYSCACTIPNAKIGDLVEITDTRLDITIVNVVSEIQSIVKYGEIQTIVNMSKFNGNVEYKQATIISRHYPDPTEIPFDRDMIFSVDLIPTSSTEPLVWSTSAGTIEPLMDTYNGRAAKLHLSDPELIGTNVTVTCYPLDSSIAEFTGHAEWTLPVTKYETPNLPAVYKMQTLKYDPNAASSNPTAIKVNYMRSYDATSGAIDRFFAGKAHILWATTTPASVTNEIEWLITSNTPNASVTPVPGTHGRLAIFYNPTNNQNTSVRARYVDKTSVSNTLTKYTVTASQRNDPQTADISHSGVVYYSLDTNYLPDSIEWIPVKSNGAGAYIDTAYDGTLAKARFTDIDTHDSYVILKTVRDGVETYYASSHPNDIVEDTFRYDTLTWKNTATLDQTPPRPYQDVIVTYNPPAGEHKYVESWNVNSSPSSASPIYEVIDDLSIRVHCEYEGTVYVNAKTRSALNEYVVLTNMTNFEYAQ